MSYPEPLYLGEGGEASATVRLGSQEPELDGKATRAGCLATGETTHGMYGLYRWDFKAPPEGGLHGFHNESGEPASMLILFAPGAPREDYFERVGTTGQMTEEERTEFYLRHDTFWA